MTQDEVKEYILSKDSENVIVFENPSFSDAFLGLSDDGRAVYSHRRMIESLVKNGEMSDEEAVEFIDYNTLRSLPYMGDRHPIVVMDYDLERD